MSIFVTRKRKTRWVEPAKPPVKPVKRQKFSSLEDYFKVHEKPRIIFDHITDLRKFSNACGMHREQIRASLPKCGYVKSITANGIECWRLTKSE